MSKLFEELASIEIINLKRSDSNVPLLDEASKIQQVRNGIIHKGASATIEQAKFAHTVASTIFVDIVGKVLDTIGLRANKHGLIEKK